MLRSVFLKTMAGRATGARLVEPGTDRDGAAMMIAVYPTVRDNPELTKMVEGLPRGAEGVHRVRRQRGLRLGRRLSRQRAASL